MLVNIGRADAFFDYSGKSIKIVDGSLKIILYIGDSGEPIDEKMVPWEDCSTNEVHWAYNDYFLSSVVDISVLTPVNDRPKKRLRL